jgi:hypothetical protein
MNKLFFIVFIFSLLPVSAQIYRIKAKDSCQVGIFVTSLHDFNMTEESYTADFWLWFNYKNYSLHLLEQEK